MKILAFEAENIKRLRAVEIIPTDPLVVVAGRNGQGKTSIMDSIWWALAGDRPVQDEPIRRGEERGHIRVSLGSEDVELTVIKRFSRDEDGKARVPSLRVEAPDGSPLQKPQQVLNALLGQLTFDPLEFMRSKPDDQFDMIARLLPEIDFAAIAKADKDDFEERTTVNRQAKEKRSAATMIPAQPGTPAEKIDTAALVDAIAEAAARNADIRARADNRDAAKIRIADLIEQGKERATRAERLRKEAEDLDAESATLFDQAETLQERLDNAPALPEPVDPVAVRAELDAAEATNRAVEQQERRKTLTAEAQALEAKADALTKAIADRARDLRKQIAAAEMPIAGLSFEGRRVLLDEVPFDQASDAQQLSASVAIAMALNPKLRIIRIRDGSLLDDEALAALAAAAEKRDFQVWVERVGADSPIGFIVEDGTVRPADAPTAPPRAAKTAAAKKGGKNG